MAEITTIQEFFWYGMHREIPALLQPQRGSQINLGPGKKKDIPGTIGIGLDTGWRAPNELSLPPGMGTNRVPDASIAAVHAYHFLEHLTGDDAVTMLREIERVLKPGGLVYIATPYYNTSLAYHALDHKSFWNEDVWQWLFDTEYYDDHKQKPWKLKVHTCFIMGIVERNISLLTQLVKN